MSTREDLLPEIQAIRDLAVEHGIRRFECWVRVITWMNGKRVGDGNAVTVDTYVGRVKARDVKSKDVIAGSDMNEQWFELGPFTPEHTAEPTATDTVAVSPDTLAPPRDLWPAEVYYVLKGPGLPTDGALFERVADDLSRPFRYMVTVKATGRNA